MENPVTSKHWVSFPSPFGGVGKSQPRLFLDPGTVGCVSEKYSTLFSEYEEEGWRVDPKDEYSKKEKI